MGLGMSSASLIRNPKPPQKRTTFISVSLSRHRFIVIRFWGSRLDGNFHRFLAAVAQFPHCGKGIEHFPEKFLHPSFDQSAFLEGVTKFLQPAFVIVPEFLVFRTNEVVDRQEAIVV